VTGTPERLPPASACDRWIALSDRKAIGEGLSPTEATFHRDHAATCTACSAEAHVFESLALELVLARPEGLEAALVAPEHRPRARASSTWVGKLAGLSKRRSRLLPVVAAAALGALGAWLVLSPEGERNELPAPAARATLAFVSGEVTVNAEPASAGRALHVGDVIAMPQGEACVRLDTSVAACGAHGTELRVHTLAAKERRLQLLRGRVVSRLLPQPTGTTFGVVTPTGTVVAKGTIFTVELMGRHRSNVRVHEGTVQGALIDGTQRTVTAPGALELTETIREAALTGDGVERDSPSIALASLVTGDTHCALDVETSPPGATIALGTTNLGPSPIAVLVHCGTHRLSVSHPGYAPLAERLTLEHGARTARSYDLARVPEAAPVPRAAPATPSAAPPSANGAPPSAGPSARTLLARARAFRVSGRAAEAAGAYRELLAQHPRSAEARAALVSLGEIELSQLGDPKAALASFEAYLRKGGPLAQEASHGKIRALRELGQRGEERAAIERFLASYPESPQAERLRQRLEEP